MFSNHFIATFEIYRHFLSPFSAFIATFITIFQNYRRFIADF
jgi:hypothetical protein